MLKSSSFPFKSIEQIKLNNSINILKCSSSKAILTKSSTNIKLEIKLKLSLNSSKLLKEQSFWIFSLQFLIFSISFFIASSFEILLIIFAPFFKTFSSLQKLSRISLKINIALASLIAFFPFSFLDKLSNT